jgi:hypothetical protein
MTPNKLSDWTIDIIINMLDKGSFEDETFDYKESLPDRRNQENKIGLKKDCAAFANSNGGFLVFGISDDKSKSSEDRILGVQPEEDFPAQFGEYPKSCYPSIEWDFRNPPLTLPNGNVIHIIHIFKSWKAPHFVDVSNGNNGVWAVMKRTNKGNEPMSIEEIRYSFLGLYEKRLKLQLLHSELLNTLENAQSAIIPDSEITNRYSLITFDTAIIDSVITDTYSITAGYSEFHQCIIKLRQSIRITNNKIQLFFSLVNVPLTNKTDIVIEHNNSMKTHLIGIKELCTIAIVHLDKILTM